MSWWVMPLKLEPVETLMHADRRLTFQVLTAFGNGGAAGGSSRVIEEDGPNRKLVEFQTPVRKGGKKVKTREWVETFEPSEVRFHGVKGPLQLLEDRITLTEEDGCTRFRYESTIGICGWWLGWLMSRFYAKRIVERLMRDHVPEMKAMVEERAKRSKLFAQTCGAALEATTRQ